MFTCDLVRKQATVLEMASRVFAPFGDVADCGPDFHESTKTSIHTTVEVFKAFARVSPVFDLPKRECTPDENDHRAGMPPFAEYLKVAFVNWVPDPCEEVIEKVATQMEVLREKIEEKVDLPWKDFDPTKVECTQDGVLEWNEEHHTHVFLRMEKWLDTLKYYTHYITCLSDLFIKCLDLVTVQDIESTTTSPTVCVDASFRVVVLLKNMVVFLQTYLVPGFVDLIPCYFTPEEEESQRKLGFFMTPFRALAMNAPVITALYRTMMRVAMLPWTPGVHRTNPCSMMHVPLSCIGPYGALHQDVTIQAPAMCAMFSWLCDELKQAIRHEREKEVDEGLFRCYHSKLGLVRNKGDTVQSIRPSACPVSFFRDHEMHILRFVDGVLAWLARPCNYMKPEGMEMVKSLGHLLSYMLYIGGGCGCSLDGGMTRPEGPVSQEIVHTMQHLCLRVSSLFTYRCKMYLDPEQSRRHLPCLTTLYGPEYTFMIVTTFMKHACCMRNNQVATALMNTLTLHHGCRGLSIAVAPMVTCMQMATANYLLSQSAMPEPLHMSTLQDIANMSCWNAVTKTALLSAARCALLKKIHVATQAIDKFWKDNEETALTDEQLHGVLQYVHDCIQLVPDAMDVSGYFKLTKDPEPFVRFMNDALDLNTYLVGVEFPVPGWLVEIAKVACDELDAGHTLVKPGQFGRVLPIMEIEDVEHTLRRVAGYEAE
jgi:hypothetical protein